MSNDAIPQNSYSQQRLYISRFLIPRMCEYDRRTKHEEDKGFFKKIYLVLDT